MPVTRSGHGDRGRVVYLALCVATIGFALGFVYPAITPQAVLWYYPLERRWAYEVEPTGLAMDFYGRLLLALATGAVSFAAGFALVHRWRRAAILAHPAVVGLVTAWALTAVLFAMLNFGWTLYFRTPIPAPLPDWYVPR